MKKHSLRDDIGYWLNRLRMKIHSSFEEKLKEHNVTIPQWCVLVSIYNKDGENVSDLASFIDVDKGFISRIVEQLVRAGWVNRLEGKDRRTQCVSLTKKAIILTEKLIACAEENEREFFCVLSSREKNELKNIFSKLLRNAGVKQLGGCLEDE